MGGSAIWMSGCLDGWMSGSTDVWMSGCLAVRMAKWLDVWMSGWLDVWMAKWLDVWACLPRQTNNKSVTKLTLAVFRCLRVLCKHARYGIIVVRDGGMAPIRGEKRDRDMETNNTIGTKTTKAGTIAAAVAKVVWEKADGWLEEICLEHGLCPDEHDWWVEVWPAGETPMEWDPTIAAVVGEMGQLAHEQDSVLEAIDAACDEVGLDPSTIEVSFVVSCVVR